MNYRAMATDFIKQNRFSKGNLTVSGPELATSAAHKEQNAFAATTV